MMLGHNFVQVDGSSFAKKRKFGKGACVRCHERKVKCSMYRLLPQREWIAESYDIKQIRVNQVHVG